MRGPTKLDSPLVVIHEEVPGGAGQVVARYLDGACSLRRVTCPSEVHRHLNAARCVVVVATIVPDGLFPRPAVGSPLPPVVQVSDLAAVDASTRIDSFTPRRLIHPTEIQRLILPTVTREVVEDSVRRCQHCVSLMGCLGNRDVLRVALSRVFNPSFKPIPSVKAAARMVGVSVRYLERLWAETREAGSPHLSGLICRAIFQRALVARAEAPAGSWSSVARCLDVEVRRLSRISRQLTGHPLSKLPWVDLPRISMSVERAVLDALRFRPALLHSSGGLVR